VGGDQVRPQTVDEGRQLLFQAVQPADRTRGLVLERGERSPLMYHERLGFRDAGEREDEKRNCGEHKSANGSPPSGTIRRPFYPNGSHAGAQQTLTTVVSIVDLTPFIN